MTTDHSSQLLEDKAPSSGALRTVTSSLTYALPHLAGAIDLLMVRQPDGTLRSSPFYVRFGKYSSIRAKSKRVTITVNGVDIDFNMQIGRTGEAYFVEEIEEEAPADITIPPSEGSIDGGSVVEGGSDDDDASSVNNNNHTTNDGNASTSGRKTVRLIPPPSKPTGDRSNSSSGQTQQVGTGGGVWEGVKRSVSAPALASLLRRNSPPPPPPTDATTTATTDAVDSNSTAAANDHTTSQKAVHEAEEAAKHGVPPMLAAAQAVDASLTSAAAAENNNMEGNNNELNEQGDVEASVDSSSPSMPFEMDASSPSSPKAVEEAVLNSQSKTTSASSPGITDTTTTTTNDSTTTYVVDDDGDSPNGVNIDSRDEQQQEAEDSVVVVPKQQQQQRFHSITKALAGLSPVHGITDTSVASTATTTASGNSNSTAASPTVTTHSNVPTSEAPSALQPVVPVVNENQGSKAVDSTATPPPPPPPPTTTAHHPMSTKLELSLCWHLLNPSMTPHQILCTFNQHILTPQTYYSSQQQQHAATGGATTTHSLLTNKNLACRLGTVVVPCSDALPVIMAALAFGPEEAAAMLPHDMIEYSIATSGDGSGSSSTNNTYTSLESPARRPFSAQQQTSEAQVESDGNGGDTIDTNTVDDSAATSSEKSEEDGTDGTTIGKAHMASSSSWKDWLSFSSWKKEDTATTLNQSPSEQDLYSLDNSNTNGATRGGGLKKTDSSTSGGGDGVPLDQEAALLAAALGQASKAQVEEIQGIKTSPTTGRPTMIVKRRAFVPPSHQLNTLTCLLTLNQQNTVTFTYGKQQLRAFIYLVPWDSKLVVSDVDGTITKSDVLGHLGHLVGFDWTHTGVAKLFSRIKSNGYPLLFLSSRSIAQASITRDYLHSLSQEGHSMPHGPVIISPDGLFPSLYREVVLRRPQEFKIRCLEDIKSLFPEYWNPFFAGFGNRDTDEISYMAVGVPSSRIFIINPKGELRKACSAVRTSTLSSIPGLSQLADSMFPALQQQQHTTSTSITNTTTSGSNSTYEQNGGVVNTNTTINSNSKEGEEDGGLDGENKIKKKKVVVSTDVPVVEEYNDVHFWSLRPSIVIEDDEVFGDPEGADGHTDEDGQQCFHAQTP